jgi:hypothetical protein
MKKLMMSLMVIALVGGLVGASFADFSDIEISEDNYFGAGELNLKVSDYLGNEYEDPNVPAFFQYLDAWPCSVKDFYVDLHNAGEGTQFVPWAYIHFMNYECWETDAKTHPGKPEPEVVAESGGVAGTDKNGNVVEVPGVGLDWGTANCEIAEHVDITLWTSTEQVQTAAEVQNWVPVDLIGMGYDKDGNGIVKMDEILCEQIELGQIPNCNKIWLDIKLHLQDVDEDDLIAQGVLQDPGTGHGWFEDTYPEAKWDHWPTNALQKDVLGFDMAFELLQNKVP